MARGDAQIDFNTNDLRIEKAKGNIYAKNSWKYDSASNEVVITIVVPKEYLSSTNTLLSHKKFEFALTNTPKIDDIYNTSLMSIEYVYINGDGLPVSISPSPAPSDSENIGVNVFVDADSGTFEDGTANGLTNLPYSAGTPNQVGDPLGTNTFPRTGVFNGGINWSSDNMNQAIKQYAIFENDSVINVTEGLTYEITSYHVANEGAFEPSQEDNAAFYWLPNGYTKEECSSVSEWLLTDENMVSLGNPVLPSDYKKTVTTFVAKTTESVGIKFFIELTTDINVGTGGQILIDDITFAEVVEEHITLFDAVEHASSDTVTRLTVERFNEILSEIVSEYSDMFSAYGSSQSVLGTITKHQYVAINKLLMGDFHIEDNIPQNEYILLNANEGSFLQSPLQGVGIAKYVQSPSSNQQLIDNVVEKFALDSLRVLGIKRDGDNLIIESEDYNIKNGRI